MRLPLSAAGVLLMCAGAARAGENVAEELAGVRREIAELRAEVARLVSRQDEQSAMLGQLLEAAGTLRADGQLDERYLAVTVQAIRKGGEAGARAMGLLDRLPAGQRCAVLGALVGDFQVQGAAREALLRRLVAEGGDAARRGVREAIERERLLPAVRQPGYGPGNQDFRIPLAVAAGDLKDKLAVDLTLDCLDDTALSAAAALAERRRTRQAHGHYGAAVYGGLRTLIWRLRGWSGQAGLEQFVNTDQRWGFVTIDSDDKLQAFRAEMAAARKWWTENREKFEFPEQTPEPPAPAMPVAPVQQPEPMPRPMKPVEHF